jgi:hypothetical protein
VAGFDAHDRGLKRREERKNLRTPQLSTQDHPSVTVDPMHLKDALGDIETDYADHRCFLLPRKAYGDPATDRPAGKAGLSMPS